MDRYVQEYPLRHIAKELELFCKIFTRTSHFIVKKDMLFKTLYHHKILKCGTNRHWSVKENNSRWWIFYVAFFTKMLFCYIFNEIFTVISFFRFSDKYFPFGYRWVNTSDLMEHLFALKILKICSINFGISSKKIPNNSDIGWMPIIFMSYRLEVFVPLM